jgi:hypothetical protein
MEFNDWWPKLSPETRQWLADNNGDDLPKNIRADIVAAGGPSDFTFTDEIVDGIEDLSNGEVPGPEN